MKKSREDVLSDFLVLLKKVARDWDVGTIGGETRLFADLGFESLDLVVLGAAVQEHYGRTFPFSDFFAQMGRRHQQDISVGEWVDFVHRHLEPDFAGAGG
jgi:acyl carrier protein